MITNTSDIVLFVGSLEVPLSDDLCRWVIVNLPREQSDKILRLKNTTSVRHTCLGLLLLEYALRGHSTRPVIFGLRTSPLGKPFLLPPGPEFNISHSGRFVVCAVSSDRVGVDVEKQENIDIDGISQTYFSDSERDLLATIVEKKDRFRMFYRIWTLKESYLKATGEGLRDPLSNFSCLPALDTRVAEVREPNGRSGWCGESWELDHWHILSLCYEWGRDVHPKRIRFQFVNHEELSDLCLANC